MMYIHVCTTLETHERFARKGIHFDKGSLCYQASNLHIHSIQQRQKASPLLMYYFHKMNERFSKSMCKRHSYNVRIIAAIITNL